MVGGQAYKRKVAILVGDWQILAGKKHEFLDFGLIDIYICIPSSSKMVTVSSLGSKVTEGSLPLIDAVKFSENSNEVSSTSVTFKHAMSETAVNLILTGWPVPV